MTPFEGKRTLMYHATFGCYKDSILKYGLNPSIGCQHKNWLISQDKVICLTFDADLAGDFCESCDETPLAIYNSGIVIFEINVSGLPLFIDPNIIRNGENTISLVYEGIISPDRLEIIKEYNI